MTLTPRLALLMTLPPLLWAGNAVVGRLLVQAQVPPLGLNALRWSLAFLLLLPLGWRVLRAPGELLARAPHLLLLGTLGVGMYNALQYLALLSSTPINVTLIAASMPAWMLAVGALFYGVRPQRRQLVGAAFSLAGVAVVIARGEPGALARVQFVAGDGWILVAIVAWAFYSWMLARPPAAMQGTAQPLVRDGPAATGRPWHWAEALLVQVLFGLVFAGGAAGLEQLGGAPAMPWNGWVLAALAFVALGPSIVAYRCWGLGVAAGGPALAAFFGNLTPVFAALLSAALLGEPPRAYHALAFALIVAGIAVSSASRRGRS